ncbi:MAG: hypothetical protein ABEH90_00980, partial [Halolamina sp.]
EDDRGQTILDYGIAVGIFFVALVFVLGTIPGMFAPFTGGSGDTQVADRIATSLAVDTLGAADTPYVLNATCTEAFFTQVTGGAAAPTTCDFDTTETDLNGVFALDSTVDIRVEIETLDGSAATLDGTTLEAGDSLPDRMTVTTARRTVGIDGQTYTLEVHVW